MDIWPIYLLAERACTINLGIDLFAEAELEADSVGDDIHLCSEDQNVELHLKWSELEDAKFPPQLELHGKLLRHFVQEGGGKARGRMLLKTRARSPSGAGLGGSSTLSVAIIGALATWARGSVDPAKDGDALVEITRDIETTVIKVPAGVQDYYGAMYGGLQALHWGVSRHRREPFALHLIPEIEKRLVLFYSGQSRNSGINNWALYKSFIDGEKSVLARFAEIVSATHDLAAALHAEDWPGVRDAIHREWLTRRTLATHISTPAMDRAFAVCEKDFGGTGKICGAGGGGCFFLYTPDADPAVRKNLIQKTLQAAGDGVRVLDFKAVPHGLEVRSF